MDSPEKVMKKEAIFKNELFQEQLITSKNGKRSKPHFSFMVMAVRSCGILTKLSALICLFKGGFDPLRREKRISDSLRFRKAVVCHK
jgi:hypothetical protein